MPTALITGANRGIGLSLATHLVDRGWRVIGACRSASDELSALDAHVVEDVDVTSDEAVQHLASRVEEPLDLLINNAGILDRTTLEDLDLDSVLEQFQVNAMGPLRVTRALLDKLSEGSKVAVVSSRMGSIGDNTSGSHYGYRMSKAAVNAAGKSLAHDLEDRGIPVVLLHPGWVQTDMTNERGNWGPDEAAAGLLERIDELDLSTTGRFVHANGEELPW